VEIGVAMDADVKPRAIKRRRGNTLERREVELVKAMISLGGDFTNDQDILAYFTRPTRSINHRLIGEIRAEKKHKGVKPASADDLDGFISSWPDIDIETGLSTRGDELLIKSREAMIAAVQTFNSAGLFFRAEIFITTAIIAWTYLLHAYYKREGVAYTYRSNHKGVEVERHWDLSQCINTGKCPLPLGVKNNIHFLIGIRNQIEHQSTGRIDDAIGAELQSCALNFNDAIRNIFGYQFGLEKRLPIALQFVSFGKDQRNRLKRASSLPQHVASFIDAFEHKLSDDEVKDPAFRLKVAFVPIAAKKAAGADVAVATIKPGSELSKDVGEVILKEVTRARYIRKEVIQIARDAGFPKFGPGDHTRLMQDLDAKNPAQGYGCDGDYNNTWVWYDRWIERVIEHCKEKGERYTLRSAKAHSIK
jgi:hypothetical protein